MSDHVPHGEQPSNKEDSESLHFSPGQGYLIAAGVFLAAAIVALMFDHFAPVEVLRGTYSILTAVAVGAFVGWLVRTEGAQVKYEHRRLSISPEQLRGLLREAYVAGAMRQHRQTRWTESPVYTARAAVPDEGDTARLLPVGLDEESIQAARRISTRLLRRDERS